MKRDGALLEAIADPGNLRLRFWKASKGKRAKADCRAFQENLDTNLSALRAQLLAGQVRVGDYHYFTVHDPKERTICAAHFRERVLHHGLMSVCEPVLERAAIFDSYACRRGKGQLAAVRRAESYARRYGWFLKMDVRKYFDSVDHTVLRGLLRRKFKDAELEQQRQELPVSEPLQQQPGQQEQQHRFPGCAGPSSSGALDDAPDDPAAILSPERGVPGQATVEQGPV